jgi:drug/metabolite transporter (DMT)-like permease
MALIGTASAFCSAIAYNTIRRIGDREDSMVVVFYFPLIATFVIGPFAISTWVEPSLIDWIWLLLTGVFVQAAQVFMTKAYALEKAANVVNYNYLGVVYGAVFGYVLFDEVITWPGFVGMSLIILSALVCARQVRAARV